METNDKGTEEERRWGLMGLLLRAEGKARALDPAIADKLAAVRVEIAEALEDPNPRFRFNEDGTISADHQSAGVIGAILARSAQHGMNYVSMEAYDDELGSLVITVQRKWKVTPHGARQAAEALARDLAARLAKHGEVVDLPVSFLPEPLPFEAVREADPTPWLRFEHKHDPPRFTCACGRHQELPRAMTVDAYEALAEVFKRQHKGCAKFMPATTGKETEET
ncbi:MAG TPA: hypothetical protein PKA64_20400 [Myxococcota bacterium]|nr:hypothetical protein [Myxococcota bacterium]